MIQDVGESEAPLFGEVGRGRQVGVELLVDLFRLLGPRLEAGVLGFDGAEALDLRASVGQVALCTDAYSDELWPGLRTAQVPVKSVQIATNSAMMPSRMSPP